jgi:pilus assembly protein CpaC
VLVLLALVGTADAQEQVVVVGQQEIIRTDYRIGRSAIGSAEVCDYRILDSRREVVLTGRSVGETTLTLWDQAGELRNEYFLRVRPSSGDANQVTDELKQLLGGIEGIRFQTVGRTVWVEGEVLTERDLERVQKVLDSYPEVRSLVELSPVTQQMLDAAAAESVKTVQLDVTIIEIDKRYRRDLGIRWSGQLTPESTLPFEGTDIGPITGVIENVLPQLNFLTVADKARVLATPTVITQSGQRAELFVGGELPIPVSLGGGAVSVEFKDFGVKLEFEPVVDTQDNINTGIYVELSSLGGPTVEGVPGLLSNRLSTSVFVKEGQSITLGGLIKSGEARNVDKIPGLGNIPILGHLFKSTRFLNDETEMLVFATPRVVRNEQAGAEIRTRVQTDFAEFTELGAAGAPKPE